MPIRVVKGLPAIGKLSEENIFVMDSERAESQDIRPLHIVVVNLMPRKETTEIQLLRALSNTPLQTKVTFLYTASYTASNTSQEYLETFYRTFEEIKDQYFDGLIITGAPVEQMPFEEVNYWDELSEIMEWSKKHVFSVLHICWGAQAGLYYHYGIKKYQLNKKIFGIFPIKLEERYENNELFRGFDEIFNMPHSRHTKIEENDILKEPELEILAKSDEAGVSIIRSKDKRKIFLTGHLEYDRFTLAKEYERDVSQNKKIDVPFNYYPEDDPTKKPIFNWKAHANLLFVNWINHYVYQETPYNLEELENL